MGRTISSIAVLVALTAVCRLAPPVVAAEPSRFEYEQPHMGTLFRIALYAPDRATADKAAGAASARVEALNLLLSDYRADSELMKLCAAFAEEVGDPVPVSEELFAVLTQAREISESSDGAFDVTVGPVVRLWRVARKTGRLPPAAELAAARRLVGWKNVELHPKTRSVRLLVPGMKLDLGGIAKGYAADEALKTVGAFGITSAMVAASGDIAVTAPPPGRDAWRLEIGGLTKDSPRRVLSLKNAAVSTSGDAEQHVVIDGVRYSHIVDPRTGLGLTGRQSVTVVAPKGILADSLTKTASILEAGKAFALLEAREGVACLIVRLDGKDEKTYRTKGFAGFLAKE